MHRLLIFNIFFIALFFSFLNAKDTVNQTKNLQCANILQNTSKNSVWRCPNIDPTLEQELSDINYETGQYTCMYRYKDTKKMATSCIYRSKYYEEQIKKVIDNNIQKVKQYKELDFDKDFNFLEIKNYDSKLINALQDLVNTNIKNLKKFFDEAYVKNPNSDMINIDKNLKEINGLVKRHLIDPYTTNTSDIPKESNFASFVVGLTTLDPSVVKGYDSNTNKLIITNEWKVNASEIVKADDKLDKEASSTIGLKLKEIWSFFFGGNIEKEKALHNYADADKYNVSSWIDIFEMKLWGWWYRFNQYFDVGYDVLATQLLFLTMAFFAMGASIRGGVRYISNREGGNSSGELKMSEDSIVKTLGVLAIVGFFFISIPSEQKDPNTGQKMRKNLTLAKQFIRFSLKEGSYYGTMFADLGTASFLEYVSKKQGLFTGEEIKNTFAYDISQMAYYYPTNQILQECLAYYNVKLDDLLSSIDKTSLTKKRNNKSTFMLNNNIDFYGFDLCKKSAKLSIIIPKNTAYSSFESDAKTQNIDDTMSKSINLLVRNHILLEDRMGWFNITSVPFTYFMMKDNDMFVDKSIDYDKIETLAKNYIRNVGLKDSSNININPLSEKRYKAYGNRNQDEFGKYFAKGVNTITGLAMYNMLPGFSEIRKSISEYLTKTLKGNKNSSIFTKLKLPGKLVKDLFKNFALDIVIILSSYFIAIIIWKMGFGIIFISSIITLIGIKIVMYAINIIKHFTISLFVVVWAFAGGNSGLLKANKYLRETIVLAIYPSIIVLGVFIFIFSYELFYTLYGFITNILIEGEFRVISLNSIANNEVESFLSYFTLYALKDFTEIMIDVFAFFVAISTIYKFPENVLKMFGLDDSVAYQMNRQVEEVSQKGEKHANPLS